MSSLLLGICIVAYLYELLGSLGIRVFAFNGLYIVLLYSYLQVWGAGGAAQVLFEKIRLLGLFTTEAKTLKNKAELY